MPTYDYQCDACDHRFELLQPITARPQRKCPKCGRPKLRRLIGPAAIVFRGSGFYATDYRSESYKKAAAADKAGGADSSGGKPTDGPAKSKEKAGKGSGEKKKDEGGGRKAER
jgi:putative FmdB family regulatory protein